MSADEQACSFFDRIFALRDRLLGNPRFHDWMSAFPLTRPIVRNRAGALFDLCSGFVYTQILLASVRVGLLERLAAGPQTASVLAAQLSMSPDATLRLLNAAVALGLASKRSGGRYGLGVTGAALRGNPGVPEMIEHNAMLYADLADPVALLRNQRPAGEIARFWPYARAARPGDLPAEEVGAYSALMSASQSFIAPDIAAAWPFERHRRLLDIGGGEGAFICAIAARVKTDLRFTLFDLPAVAARAKDRLEAAGLGPRVDTVGGDFLEGPLPQGADLVTLVRIIHDHEDEAALKLLRNIAAVLPPDGTLLIAEPMSGTAGAARAADAYFSFFFLAMGRGRPRTPAEIERLLRSAGFRRIRRIATRRPLMTSLIAASH
ncbi:methyltransferase [Methylocella silvestris]|uniref:Methyltransferase n=1 Tax=Methylocella silvestris TaxID=199596 RepID=A0A2J7TDG7_METSI|nr:methyltransferase [Methylocella silvestris]PNG24808.1 methyltransferase [Methylocella silvestris]